MENDDNMLNAGLTYEKTTAVDEKNIAKAVGSGNVEVFATPMMIALMEEAAAECIAPYLEEGQTSVGTEISSTHLSATPIGMKVTAKAVVTEVNGKSVKFDISAYDESGIIGEGKHSRFILNKQKFEEKAKSKLI